MKRKFFYTLSFMILLLLFSFLSFAEEDLRDNSTINLDDVLGKSNGYFKQMIAKSEKIFLLGSGLVEFDVKTKQCDVLAKRIMPPQSPMDRIFPYGDGFVGFDLEEKQIHKIVIENETLKAGELIGRVEADELLEQGMFVEDDVLYFPNIQYNDTEEEKMLIAYHLRTGNIKKYAAKPFVSAAPYKAGKLFTYYTKSDKDGKDKAAFFGLLDKETGLFEEMHHTLVGNSEAPLTLFYNSKKDAFYYVQNGVIKKIISSKNAKVCAYIPSLPIQSVAEMRDGRMAFLQNDESYLLHVRTLDEENVPKEVLKIAGELDFSEVNRIARKMGGIPITVEENSWNDAQELVQDIRSEKFDIAGISLRKYDMDTLINKGYVAEIKNESVKKYVASMHDAIKKTVMYDGKLYALPIRIELASDAYTPECFEKFNVPLPRTYEELLDMQYNWYKNADDSKNDYSFSLNEERLCSIHTLVRAYVKERIVHNKEVDFDTAAFRTVLEKVLRNSKEIRKEKISADNEEAAQEFFEKTPVFLSSQQTDLYYLTHAAEESEERLPIILTMDKEASPYLLVDLELYILNPKSKNLDIATKYLEQYCTVVDPAEKAELIKGFEGEVLNPDFEKEKSEILAELEAVQTWIAEAKGAEKATLEENYGYFLENYEKDIEGRRVLVSKEAAQKFAELMSKKLLINSSHFAMFTSRDVLGGDLHKRFQAGQIPIEQFIQELNNKVKLMMEEREK